MEWVNQGFSFRGEIRPRQFLLYELFAVGVSWFAYLLSLFASSLGIVALVMGGVVTVLIYIGALWVSLAALIKRFRDAGLSFLWLLLTFVPLGGPILLIMALAVRTKAPIREDHFDPFRAHKIPDWLNQKGGSLEPSSPGTSDSVTSPACISCGVAVTAESRFCPNCGVPIAQ
jgi:uncharacterized membrane protein YhaH (DUF805 family)